MMRKIVIIALFWLVGIQGSAEASTIPQPLSGYLAKIGKMSFTGPAEQYESAMQNLSRSEQAAGEDTPEGEFFHDYRLLTAAIDDYFAAYYTQQKESPQWKSSTRNDDYRTPQKMTSEAEKEFDEETEVRNFFDKALSVEKLKQLGQLFEIQGLRSVLRWAKIIKFAPSAAASLETYFDLVRKVALSLLINKDDYFQAQTRIEDEGKRVDVIKQFFGAEYEYQSYLENRLTQLAKAKKSTTLGSAIRDLWNYVGHMRLISQVKINLLDIFQGEDHEREKKLIGLLEAAKRDGQKTIGNVFFKVELEKAYKDLFELIVQWWAAGGWDTVPALGSPWDVDMTRFSSLEPLALSIDDVLKALDDLIRKREAEEQESESEQESEQESEPEQEPGPGLESESDEEKEEPGPTAEQRKEREKAEEERKRTEAARREAEAEEEAKRLKNAPRHLELLSYQIEELAGLGDGE